MLTFFLWLWLLLASSPAAFFFHSPCCCGCDQCTAILEEYQVVLAGVSNLSSPGCLTCSTVNGTYIVPLWAGRAATQCWWRLVLTNSCYNPSPFGGATDAFGIDVKISTPNAIMTVAIEQALPFVSDLTWRKDMGTTPIDCAAVSGEDLPYAPTGSDNVVCEGAGSTCTITAL